MLQNTLMVHTYDLPKLPVTLLHLSFMIFGILLFVPPPPCPNTGRFWFRGQKCGNTGLLGLDKPVLPRGTYHGTHVAGNEQRTVHDYKRVSNRPAYTPKHMSTWHYNYIDTLPPILTFPAACTELQTTFSIGLQPQKRRF